jgi:hypothetical protein
VRRGFFLAAVAATIGSLLTYTAGVLTTPGPLRCEAGPRVVRTSTPGASAGATTRVQTAFQPPPPVAATRQASRQDADEAASLRAAVQREALSMQKQKELGELFSGLVEAGSSADPEGINTRIENRFYAEDWNQQWAGSREQGIRTLFATHADLDGITPLQVTCRSKNCQVVLAASDQEQVRDLSRKFMLAATRGDVGMENKVVAFFPDAAAGSVVFYLSENGNTDLFR